MASNFRNAERYYDPTAGAAITNIEKGERMNWNIGDIITATRQGNPVEKKLLVLANFRTCRPCRSTGEGTD